MIRISSPDRPLRILHVVGSMDRGGTETWLMHALRRVDRSRFEFHFLVHGNRRFAYSDEIEALGGRLVYCPAPKSWLSYTRDFTRAVKAQGPYDAIHTHLQHFNGVVLRQAARIGIPVRIAHSHNDLRKLRACAGFRRKIYLSLTDRWIRRWATAGVACSQAAAECLFGPRWSADPRWSIRYCAVDLTPFRGVEDVGATRSEWNIPPGALVVGNVGRLEWQKNHAKMLEVAAALARRHRDFRLLLVGVGPLRSQIEEQARSLGIQDRTIFTGSRSDVPRLLKAMDVLLFPSHHEGLGLALIEAQAAGVPCVLSDQVPPEAEVVPGLVERLSLSADAEAWADAVVGVVARKAAATRAGASPAAALAVVEQSPFNIATAVTQLEHFYCQVCSAGRAS